MTDPTTSAGLEASVQRLTAAAQRALDHAAGRPVPDELARAIAAGVGDRTRVAALSRDMFGAGAKPLALVLFDTDRIASYVFESIRPPVLAGASKILHDLNQEAADEHPDEILYSGGGEGMLLVEAGRAPALCQSLERRFSERTGGALRVTVTSLPVAPEDFIGAPGAGNRAAGGIRLVAGTQAVLARLRDAVQSRKQACLPMREPVGSDRDRCISCRDRAAGSRPSPRTDRDGKCEGYLCDPCALRWDEGKVLIDGHSFEDLVKQFREGALGERAGSAKAQYLGFLYADGNAMGSVFGRLASLAELSFASGAIAQVFAGANRRVEQEVARRVPVGAGEHLPLLSLLGGGDEAIWILPGALAVQVAAELAQWIDTEVRAVPGLAALLADNGMPALTFGAGLVLCDQGFPVRYQHELAGALLKSAKARFQGAPAAEVGSSIDFVVLTESSPWSEDLKAMRRLAYRTDEKGFLRTCRPYRYEEFVCLLGLAARANQHHLGKSQLHALQAGAGEGRTIFLNYLRYQLARPATGAPYRAWMKDVDLADPAAVERFFLRRLPPDGDRETWGTWVPDLLELKPFIDLLAGATS